LLDGYDGLVAKHDQGWPLGLMHHAAGLYFSDQASFRKLRVREHDLIWTRLVANGRFPSRVFTDLGHAVYPWAPAIYDYISDLPNRRVKFVHLLRHPVDTCRSMLKVERFEGGNGFSTRPPVLVVGQSSAEVAAGIWNGINLMCRDITSSLPPEATMTVRVEDLSSPEALEELFRFMEIIWPGTASISHRIETLGTRARHSHLARTDLSTQDSSPDELAVIEQLTREIGQMFGY